MKKNIESKKSCSSETNRHMAQELGETKKTSDVEIRRSINSAFHERKFPQSQVAKGTRFKLHGIRTEFRKTNDIRE